MIRLVAIQSFYKFLPCMFDYLACQRYVSDLVIGFFMKFERNFGI